MEAEVVEREGQPDLKRLALAGWAQRTAARLRMVALGLEPVTAWGRVPALEVDRVMAGQAADKMEAKIQREGLQILTPGIPKAKPLLVLAIQQLARIPL